MGGLRVFLFGKFRVQFSNKEFNEISSSKAQELFCYLLLNRGRPHYREILASVLWENTSTVQSKQYLRRALWQLQSNLSKCNSSQEDTVLLIEGDWIQFNPIMPLWVDAISFEQSCNKCQGTTGQYLDNGDAQHLCEAIELYRGDLLEGWFQDWCLFERERFRQLLLKALDKLMLYYESNSKYETSIEYGIRILRYDRAREHTHRRLMRLYDLSGKRTDALRQYENCVSILDEELGVQPAQSTRELYEKIRSAGHRSAPITTRTYEGSLPRKQDFLQDVHSELLKIRSILTGIHKQVQRQIEVVESTIEQRN